MNLKVICKFDFGQQSQPWKVDFLLTILFIKVLHDSLFSFCSMDSRHDNLHSNSKFNLILSIQIQNLEGEDVYLGNQVTNHIQGVNFQLQHQKFITKAKLQIIKKKNLS